MAQWLRPACQHREPGLDPGSGRIPHATGQLSPCAPNYGAHMPPTLGPRLPTAKVHTVRSLCASTTEPACCNRGNLRGLETTLQSKRGHHTTTREGPPHTSRGEPPHTTREGPPHTTRGAPRLQLEKAHPRQRPSAAINE